MPYAGVPATSRADAMRRFAVLRPHLEENVSLAATAKHADTVLRTVQRWLARYRTDGPAGLTRMPRSDWGHRRLMSELASLIEGMALDKPRLSAAAIHRRISGLAQKQNWPTPSYGSVYTIVRGLDPGMITLALEGHVAWRDRFELIYHHRAERPNANQNRRPELGEQGAQSWFRIPSILRISEGRNSCWTSSAMRPPDWLPQRQDIR